jgi:hypothetical protein
VVHAQRLSVLMLVVLSRLPTKTAWPVAPVIQPPLFTQAASTHGLDYTATLLNMCL